MGSVTEVFARRPTPVDYWLGVVIEWPEEKLFPYYTGIEIVFQDWSTLASCPEAEI